MCFKKLLELKNENSEIKNTNNKTLCKSTSEVKHGEQYVLREQGCYQGLIMFAAMFKKRNNCLYTL